MVNIKFVVQIGTSEWEDTVNTEMTSGSVSETSSQHSSCNSDISEKDILGNDNNATTGQAIQHVCVILERCLFLSE